MNERKKERERKRERFNSIMMYVEIFNGIILIVSFHSPAALRRSSSRLFIATAGVNTPPVLSRRES